MPETRAVASFTLPCRVRMYETGRPLAILGAACRYLYRRDAGTHGRAGGGLWQLFVSVRRYPDRGVATCDIGGGRSAMYRGITPSLSGPSE
jgi:hypothetical protein